MYKLRLLGIEWVSLAPNLTLFLVLFSIEITEGQPDVFCSLFNCNCCLKALGN